jgi:YD repeat-containing protein
VQTNYTYYPDGQVCSVSRQVATGTTAPTCNGTTNSSWETTQYTYTLADMVYTVTDPLGNTTTTTYDADDRVLTVTQQVTATQNRQRTYSYDALSRLYQLSDTSAGNPGTLLETHSYTLNGNGAKLYDANSHYHVLRYDGFDRLSHHDLSRFDHRAVHIL